MILTRKQIDLRETIRVATIKRHEEHVEMLLNSMPRAVQLIFYRQLNASGLRLDSLGPELNRLISNEVNALVSASEK